MTIWTFIEDIDFNAVASVNTTSGHFVSTCRAAFAPNLAEFLTPAKAITASATVWFKGWCYTGSATGSALNFLEFRKGVSAYLRLQANASTGNVLLQRLTSGSWTTLQTVSVGTWNANTLYKFAVKVVVHGSTGTFQFWRDGTLVIDYTGNTQGDNPGTTLDGFGLSTFSASGTASQWSGCMWSDDTDIRSVFPRLLTWTAAGTTNDWTGAYTDIDETTLDANDVLTTGGANNVALFNVSDLPSTVGGIVGVVVTAAAIRDGTAPTKLDLAVRTGGTNYFSSDLSVGTSYTTLQNFWATNPAGSSWDKTAVDALQAGFKSIA